MTKSLWKPLSFALLLALGLAFESAPAQADDTLTGTVKFINEVKGIGFITITGTGREIFFSPGNIKVRYEPNPVRDKISAGDAVTFDELPGKKGPSAINIQLAKPAM